MARGKNARGVTIDHSETHLQKGQAGRYEAILCIVLYQTEPPHPFRHFLNDLEYTSPRNWNPWLYAER